jgi:hypothetical protein
MISGCFMVETHGVRLKKCMISECFKGGTHGVRLKNAGAQDNGPSAPHPIAAF